MAQLRGIDSVRGEGVAEEEDGEIVSGFVQTGNGVPYQVVVLGVGIEEEAAA